MTDITELAQSLKALANNAGADYWQAKKISGDFYVIRKGSYKRECGYTTYQPIAEIDHKPTRDYVAMANPTNILALVEALEKAQQRIAELEESNAQVIQSRDHYKRMTEEGLKQLAEARTVKLPDLRQIVSGDRYVWSDGVYNYSQDVKVALAAAGIKVEVE
ncbi:ead/Ea22-like family protein [Klebsiella sp. Kps]|uniref:ead/Ea22-like family protein n=1 Tax=Klebsiella sp. Kps TaxID=2758579 RepID=UPI001648224B|nr:ead/Ea22-like family protein [Klebsiella sp. Kps]MBC3636162.1 ead/Ea22-like family protein [Klebsiella sp. Kps]